MGSDGLKELKNFIVDDNRAPLINVHGHINDVLQPTKLNAGYDEEDLASDLIGVFESNPKMQDLHTVNNVWENTALGIGKKRMVARRESAKYYKNFHRLRRCEARDEILKMTGGDPVAAAQAFIDYMASSGGSGSDPMGQAVSKLKKIGKIPFSEDKKGADGKAPGGKNAGTGSGAMIAKKLRVAPLIDECRRRYDFASRRSFTRISCPWPEDDLDVRPLRSLGEINRIPAASFAQDDDLFYHNLVTRNLAVVEHFQLEPKSEAFVMLIDVSGSMASAAGKKAYTREEYAVASAIAFLDEAKAGGNTVTLIRFDGAAHPPIAGTPEEVAAEVWKCLFTGGGTCFEKAFRAADKVTGAKRVVMITDGSSTWTTPPIAPLDVLMVADSQGDGSEYLAGLRKISQRVEVMV